jgi:hypothetical protein
MPKLLLLSVSDCSSVYSRIIYFLVPLSCKAQVLARDPRHFSRESGRAGILDPRTLTTVRNLPDYGLADASLCESG